MNKKLIINILGISLFSVINNNLIFQSEASNISKNQEDLSPLITYTTEKIGDREKMRVTVTVEDRSGTGIKEFRDHNNNLISGMSKTIEFNKRVKATFTAIDNNNNKSQISIDLNWINPLTSTVEEIKSSRIKNGSSYWTSSNIREWLNSNEDIVSYTGLSPTNKNTNNQGYDTEPGFLNGFTQEEQEAIAVTKRKNLITSADNIAKEGGTNKDFYPGVRKVFLSHDSHYELAFNHDKLQYSTSNDKVFFLNTQEMYWYLNRRGIKATTNYTEQARRKHNLNSGNATYFIQGSVWHSYQYIDRLYFVSSTNYSLPITYGTVNSSGIRPAINIKPDYTFKNGKKAKDLDIGETVEFGTYLEAPIEWIVVNIDKGYPLLLSKQLIDKKYYDSQNDLPRVYSDYIDFGEEDVISELNYLPTDKSTDITPPKATILNQEELESRKNSSFDLNIEFSDNESGVKYLILPDGNRTTNTTISYNISSNGEYVFTSMDNAGNFNEYLIFVSNINDEPIVNISYNEDWNTLNAEIDIKSSNAVTYKIPSRIFTAGSEINAKDHIFPNYVSYVGNTFRVKGTIELIDYDSEILTKFPNDGVGVGMYYKSKVNNEYTNGYKTSYTPRPVIAKVKDLIERGSISFDMNITIPKYYISDLAPCITTLSNKYGYTFTTRLVDIEYSIDDDSDFAINSIELPSGQIIENVKEYTDTITEDGIHNLTYKVLDNRGKITEKSITVKVDKTAPTLNLNYNANITNQNISVNISASDTTSGVKRIKLPNGNYITNLNSTYTISGDGEYIFECEDIAGNITTKTITINNIDKEKPNVIIDKNNTEWTNQGVQININTRD